MRVGDPESIEKRFSFPNPVPENEKIPYPIIKSVDRAGWERTEVGESAPSRLEDSPRPGRTKCELYETLQDLIMGAGKKHQSTRRAS